MAERFIFLKEYMYPYILMVLFSAGFLAFLFSWFGISVSGGILFLIVLAETALLQLLFRYRKYPVMYLFLFLTALLATFIAVRNQEALKLLWEGYFAWLYPIGNAAWEKSLLYETVSVAVLLLLITAPMHYLQQFFTIRKVISLIFMILSILYAFLRLPVSKVGMVCGIGYILYCLIELIYRHVYGADRAKQKEAMTSLAAVILLFCVILCAMPYSQNPYSWDFVKNAWSSLVRTGQNLYTDVVLFFQGGDGSFEVSFSGYSEKTRIGGGIINSDDPVMQTRVEGSKTNLYLIGNIQSIYANGEWKSMETAYHDKYLDYQWDTMELLYALYRNGRLEQNQDLLTLQSVQIEFLKLHTRSIFYPFKTVTNSIAEKEYDQENENLRFYKIHEAPTKYRMSFMNLNLNSDALTEFIRLQEGYVYSAGNQSGSLSEFKASLNAAYPSLRSVSIPEDVEETLRERADYIEENYLQIPEAYEERLRELTVSVTEDQPSAYGKLKAIEAYLSEYTYTLMPPDTPDGKDVIEHFIFDSKEGYCTYFASAFAFMSRSLGYPARYVTGFCVPIWKENSTTYTVMSKNAHAWPEVYLEGIGWIPFEPTAGYRDIRYTPWMPEEVIWSDTQRWSVTKEDETQNEEADMPDMTEQDAAEAEKAEKNEKWKVYQYAGILLGGILLLALLIVSGYLLWKICRYHYRYRRGTRNEKMEWNTEFLILLFGTLHFELKEGQTFWQYAQGIHGEYPDVGMLDFAAGYMGYRYGNCPVSEEQLEQAEQIKSYFRNRIAKRYGKLSYVRFMLNCYLNLPM